MIPLVSVNITTYNRAHLLPRCLDSVLSQSYENVEIIIVDDCSTDNTNEIVQKYIEKYDNIKYIRHNENKKLPTARNTAWKNSKGKYIAFMDDDDEWIDDYKLQKQVSFFEKNNNKKLALICTSVRLYQKDNKYKDKVILKPENMKQHILSRNGIMYTPTVMTIKKVIEEVGGFDKSLPRGIDGDFYRTCIVKFDLEVEFMKDITTAIYEFGDDRITPQNSINSLIKSYKAHCVILKKYFFYFFRYPKAFLIRLQSLISVTLKVIKEGINNVIS